MINIKDILHAVTRPLGEGTKLAIFTETEEVSNNKECFYVSVTPYGNRADGRYINARSITVDIIYKPKDYSGKTVMYDMIDTLNSIFKRFITVKHIDRKLLIKETRERILKDSLGYYLSYSMDFEFRDVIEIPEKYEYIEVVDKEIEIVIDQVEID